MKMFIWVLGMLFTLGFLSEERWEEIESNNKPLTVSIGVFVAWPLILGKEVQDTISGKHRAEN